MISLHFGHQQTRLQPVINWSKRLNSLSPETETTTTGEQTKAAESTQKTEATSRLYASPEYIPTFRPKGKVIPEAVRFDRLSMEEAVKRLNALGQRIQSFGTSTNTHQLRLKPISPTQWPEAISKRYTSEAKIFDAYSKHLHFMDLAGKGLHFLIVADQGQVDAWQVEKGGQLLPAGVFAEIADPLEALLTEPEQIKDRKALN